jgi:membrane protein DedA with SNARE-associated domain
MTDIISLVETYRYLIILPLGVLEGPILSVICGFLVTLGFLDWYIAYPILVLADAIGDWLFYLLGRFGQPIIIRWGRYAGITIDRLESTKRYFTIHHFKMVSASKLIHAGGLLGLIAAGAVKMPFMRFASQCLIISFLQTGFLFLMGVLFGNAYAQISHYLDYYTAACIVIALVIATYFLLQWLKSGKPQ